MQASEPINQLTAHLFRENSGKMIAILSKMYGLNKIDRVLDIVQDTFETALYKWRFSGIPENPTGWLIQVAKNKAINTLKRDNKTQSFSSSEYLENFDESFENELETFISPTEINDSQLRLLFICCHPELSPKNQIIITLHILCGFGIPEIANSLIMNDEAVKKALTRSKSTLRKLNNILQTPLLTQSNQRIKTVQTILYLMFNEGYRTTRGKNAINHDLCYEAMRLAKLLENKNNLQNSTTYALLSLMFFNISRFPARVNAENEWLNLEEQDRGKWNKVFIEEGYDYLNQSVQTEILSRFHIEALIASLHCSADSFEKTDWQKIAFLYLQLEEIEPSPVIALNRIIAESYISNSCSIRALDQLNLKNNFLVFAAKADIYKRQGDLENAQKFYKLAVPLAESQSDSDFLKRRLFDVSLNE